MPEMCGLFFRPDAGMHGGTMYEQLNPLVRAVAGCFRHDVGGGGRASISQCTHGVADFGLLSYQIVLSLQAPCCKANAAQELGDFA